VAVLAALALSEWARQSLTALFQKVEASEAIRLAFLGYIAVVATRYYLNPGQVFMGDTETHTLRSAMVAEHLRNLNLPIWSNYWYGGFPLLQYYAPLFFVLDGLLSLVFGDVHTATKLLLWSTHVGSVFTMYLYLRGACGRALPSVLGAVAYGLAFHRVHMILYRGDLQLSILFLLYPLVLLSTETILDRDRRTKRSFLALMALLALMILNHQGYAFFGLVFTSLYVVVRVATSPGDARSRLGTLTYFGAAVTSALLACVFMLVPFVFGMTDVRGMPNTPYGFLIPNLRAPLLLTLMFRWNPIGRVENVGYMGISIGLFAAAGIVHGIRRRQSIPLALGLCALASLFMSQNFQQYNIKNANFLMFYLAALSAWAPIAIEEWSRVRVVSNWKQAWGGTFPARVTLILVSVILLDLGPTTFHSVYRESYDFKEQMYARLRAIDDDARVIEHQRLHYAPEDDPRRYFDAFKLGTPSAYTKILTPLGFFHEAAGKSFGYNIELVKNLHRDLVTNSLSEVTLDGLYLMGVKFVIFRDRYRYFTPQLNESSEFTFNENILEMRASTPLIFSTRVTTTSEIEGFDPCNVIDTRQYFDPETYDYSGRILHETVMPLVGAMAIDRQRGVAERLIAREPGLEGTSTPLEQLETEVRDVDFTLDRMTLRYISNGDAVGRLPMNYFPFLEVTVDGEPVAFHASAMNCILVSLPAGEHILRVRGVLSPLRIRTFWLSLVFLGVLLLVPRPLFANTHPSKDRRALG
jgi:hypothetical protein